MKEDIELIKERNNRVEADKAWEISDTRRILIALMTYVVIVIFLWSIGVARAGLHAVVPTIGFILSTFTLPFFKKWWLKKVYRGV